MAALVVEPAEPVVEPVRAVLAKPGVPVHLQHDSGDLLAQRATWQVSAAKAAGVRSQVRLQVLLRDAESTEEAVAVAEYSDPV